MDVYTLKFDGACWPNPGGKASYGFIISRGPEEIESGHGIVGQDASMSNNVAEFAALAFGLHAFYKLGTGPCHLNVKGDSNLVINIMSRKWRPRADKLYWPAYTIAQGALLRIRKQSVSVTFEWIPRELNQDCDDLSKFDNPCPK